MNFKRCLRGGFGRDHTFASFFLRKTSLIKHIICSVKRIRNTCQPAFTRENMAVGNAFFYKYIYLHKYKYRQKYKDKYRYKYITCSVKGSSNISHTAFTRGKMVVSNTTGQYCQLVNTTGLRNIQTIQFIQYVPNRSPGIAVKPKLSNDRPMQKEMPCLRLNPKLADDQSEKCWLLGIVW